MQEAIATAEGTLYDPKRLVEQGWMYEAIRPGASVQALISGAEWGWRHPKALIQKTVKTRKPCAVVQMYCYLVGAFASSLR